MQDIQLVSLFTKRLQMIIPQIHLIERLGVFEEMFDSDLNLATGKFPNEPLRVIGVKPSSQKGFALIECTDFFWDERRAGADPDYYENMPKFYVRLDVANSEMPSTSTNGFSGVTDAGNVAKFIRYSDDAYWDLFRKVNN